ncbi:TGS domain-containing protein, partial [Francisella tularensis]
MINIRFPDGSIREFESGVNSLDVAKSIYPSLAKATMAAYIDDHLKDATD